MNGFTWLHIGCAASQIPFIIWGPFPVTLLNVAVVFLASYNAYRSLDK